MIPSSSTAACWFTHHSAVSGWNDTAVERHKTAAYKGLEKTDVRHISHIRNMNFQFKPTQRIEKWFLTKERKKMQMVQNLY